MDMGEMRRRPCPKMGYGLKFFLNDFIITSKTWHYHLRGGAKGEKGFCICNYRFYNSFFCKNQDSVLACNGWLEN